MTSGSTCRIRFHMPKNDKNRGFKKDQVVKFVMKFKAKTIRGRGLIKKTGPRGAVAGAARRTVVDEKTGAVRRPYATQCQAA